ncbi:MAG: acyl-CoA dehydrogenase family protein [Alphaproteobacteria bacterium]|nr:acyl-CoA dehydrogenase family protein [Alphaproteobacteria bacterium]
MDLHLSPEDQAFRDEVKAFLDEKLTPDMREEAARSAGVWAEGPLVKRWWTILAEKGWIAPAWPVAYGGCGWGLVRRYLWDTALAENNAPVLPVMGVNMCGPVVMHFGTQAQKDFFLPRMLSGEHYWCQGYSEPGAGSDLAALQTKAVRDGDDYIVNGVKIWTTHAHFANWIFVLVRTASMDKPQKGISFLLCDMSTPGITVRPIISNSGDHEVNYVFFDNVRVPATNLIGQENDGWTVAKYLLEFERGGAYAARLQVQLKRLKALAAQEAANGARLIDDEDFRAKFAALAIEVEGVAASERQVVSQMSAGKAPGASVSSVLKTRGSETGQKVTELALEAMAAYAAPDFTAARLGQTNWAPGPDYAVPVMARYLNMRAATIYGGSSEVQRNILAKTALGL